MNRCLRALLPGKLHALQYQLEGNSMVDFQKYQKKLSFPYRFRSPINSCLRKLLTVFTRHRLKVLLISWITAGYLFSEPVYPPVSSTFDLIIVNRRFVSHIAFENTDGRNYLTLILTHGPAYHAFHATSHPLHYDCVSARHCYEEAVKLDRHLQSGWNIALALNGSKIEEIIYLDGRQHQFLKP
jgi:hypothetical protein